MSLTWPQVADMLVSLAWFTLTGRFWISTFSIGRSAASGLTGGGCCCGAAALWSLMVMEVRAGLGLWDIWPPPRPPRAPPRPLVLGNLAVLGGGRAWAGAGRSPPGGWSGGCCDTGH